MHFCRLCPNAVLALRYGQPALSNTGAKLASQPRIPVALLSAHQLRGLPQQYATAPAAAATSSSRFGRGHKVTTKSCFTWHLLNMLGATMCLSGKEAEGVF